ncbi:MAG: hypothetical protein ACOYYS_27625 [Chloroflexota bacterium]
MEKVLLIVGAQAYPPNPSGASSILYNLLDGIEPEAIDVLSGEPAKTNSNTLPFEAVRISAPWLSHLKWLWRFQALEDILRYLMAGLRLTAQKKYQKIMLVFPDTGSFVAGYLVARLRGLKYQIYLIDLLSDSRLNKLEWLLLRFLEKQIIKEAEVVYSLSQGIVDFYQPAVQREYVLLPHCITLDKVNDVNWQKASTHKKTIIFSGQIHEISLDALQNLIRAVRLMDEYDISVQIYTNRPESFLREKGLLDDFVETGFVSGANELLEKLQQADILFSPIAFEPKYLNQARTCFPTKTFDYVRAHRPILVHAPTGYFYTQYMAANGSALCVTDFSPEYLKNGITALLNDNQLQKGMIASAVTMVEKHHATKKIQSRLIQHLFRKD